MGPLLAQSGHPSRAAQYSVSGREVDVPLGMYKPLDPHFDRVRIGFANTRNDIYKGLMDLTHVDLTHVASFLIVSVAGLVRGTTGFGGAMLMTPLLSALIGPTQAVVIALILEIGGGLVMFPEVLPKVRWRMLGYLTLPALLTVPLGGYILLTVDPTVARKMIAAVVVFFSGIMLLGWRYNGSPRPLTSMALGSLVGVLLGATSVGAPPVIIYLLSGPDPIVVTRANLTIFVSAISIIGVAMLAVAGAITWRLALSAGFLTMPFFFATWLGGKLFRQSSEPTARRFALTVMISVAVASLFI